MQQLWCCSSGCCNKVQPGTLQTFVSHDSAGWKSEVRAPAWSDYGEDPILHCRLLNSCCEITWQMGRGRSLGSLLKAVNASHYLPDPCFLIPSPWVLAFQHMTWGVEGTNTEPMAYGESQGWAGVRDGILEALLWSARSLDHIL